MGRRSAKEAELLRAGIRVFLFNVGTGPLTATTRAVSERVIHELRAAFADGSLHSASTT